MAEEVKTTSSGDYVEGIETVNSDPIQNEAQDNQGVEEKGTGTVEGKNDGGASISGDEAVGESDVDTSSADSSERGEMKEEEGEKVAPSGDPEEGENVEEKGEGRDEMEGGEAKEKERDASKAKEEELTTEGEVPAKEGAQVEEGAGEAKREDKGEPPEEAGAEIKEEKGEGKVEAESPTEEKTADQKESGEQEIAKEESGEERKSGEEETVVASGKAKTESEVTEKEDEGKGAEEEMEESVAQEGEVAVAEEEGEEAGLVSSEELTREAEEGIPDEEGIPLKKGFLNKFHRRFDRKWVISGAGVFMLVVGLVWFLIVMNLSSTDVAEVKFLEEIAGPVYNMKFFLPLTVGSGKTRFVKVTVAIELMEGGFKKEIDKKVSDLRKEIIDLVLAMSPEEVKSAHGKEVLRKEITTSLNRCLRRKCIKNTYFTEMVIL